MPTLYVVAGPNGCGKSTLTRTAWLRELEIIDPDAIARAMAADIPGQAAREAVRRRRAALRAGRTHLLETTLAGSGVLRHMDDARSHGYRIELHYVSVDSPDLALDRIRTRVASGMRRDFIECAAGQVRLTGWCRGWIERIAEIYRLNEARLEHYDPGLERRTPAFDAAQGELEAAVARLFADAEAELAGLSERARRAKPLRSLLNHREGLCVFVDKPQVPMDNNKAERALRGPVIGRRLSFGSNSEDGARFTAIMYSVVGTLSMNGIDVLRWLEAWLEACAKNGRKPPDDMSPWLPWSMSEERRRELMAPG